MLKTAAVLAALGGVLGAAAPASAGSGSRSADEATGHLVHAGTGYHLSTWYGANGYAAFIGDPQTWRGLETQWRFSRDRDGVYTIYRERANDSQGGCLTYQPVAAPFYPAGWGEKTAYSQPCNGKAAQDWIVRRAGGATFTISPVKEPGSNLKSTGHLVESQAYGVTVAPHQAGELTDRWHLD
ncbi:MULTISPECIES: RICIN domain-containing protein [Streptomyces]|uniref:Uncharacterized protein n=1 Tax=Streptomyces nanshensis TaxID=518642 RepID=A0A1E7L816_9ACTN|nr:MULTISPECIES: RICIN domain-containing protein [Streptomyces]OEV12324.1 hypothetical protein AN218_08840 [Streptomyces nanshensis]